MTQVTQNKEAEAFLIELFRAFFSDPVRFRTSTFAPGRRGRGPFLRQGKQAAPRQRGASRLVRQTRNEWEASKERDLKVLGKVVTLDPPAIGLHRLLGERCKK